MGMSQCTQTGHSLVLELFQDATQRKRTASGDIIHAGRQREQTCSSLER